ncbi:hypothetical protein Clacol_004522 [Clathrus columnatus]|uniref:Cytochrome P450 n=1 Tax=Clathrus columnatus TaxID=1419009 RepID=A0AAV5ACT0_9AGAM|nr:hypothetical protein Clacol_004522 [Clathrus columnatus]
MIVLNASFIYALPGLALVLFLLYKAVSIKHLRQPAPFPPGPEPLPVLGNILDMPKTQPWKTFSQWGKEYGGIVHATALGTHYIIINDPQYAVELLDKKGKIYSDRPRLMMAGEIIGWGDSPPLCQLSETWSEYRRLLASFIGSRSKVEQFSDVLQRETNELLKRMLDNPINFVDHFRSFSGTIVLRLTYGYKAASENEPLVRLVVETLRQFSETTISNAFLVDVLPILRFVPSFFPGAAWKRKAIRYRECLDETLRKPYEWTKQQMIHLNEREERILQWAAVGIYGGGTETTVAALTSFILGITRHTTELQKAQSEIDAVIGKDRLPTLEDRSRLPYFEALCLEIHRKYPFGPLGLPHVPREDDVHDGYYIPKDSVVIANLWQFCQDEKLYPNPQVFSPERFIGDMKQLDPMEILFGYGRRHLAEAALWLACANIIAAFDIRPPIKDGKYMIPPGNFLDGSVTHPEPFECVITPRSKLSAYLVQQA